MHRPRAPPDFQKVVQYGQLLAIYAFSLTANPALRLAEPRTFVLAQIRPCAVYEPSPIPSHPSYGRSSHNRARTEVVDSDVLSASVMRLYRDGIDGYLCDRSDGERDPDIVVDNIC